MSNDPCIHAGSLPEEDVWDAAGQIVHNAISRVEGSKHCFQPVLRTM